MIKIGINGFGRIGRIALRVLLEKYSDKLLPVAINTSGSMDIEGWAHLFEYDSVYGKYMSDVICNMSNVQNPGEIGRLVINNLEIPVMAEREPAKIPWKDYGVDVVLECTGVFRDKKEASGHFIGGAKKIVVSAPAKGVETFVLGVNDKKYAGDLIISNASCTTNCVAPVTKVILDNFGVQKAFMTTMHAYTADQELVDGSHKDLRRARAAAINIIPTSTGAAITATQVLPQLKGVFDGLAYRVPVACGSVSDFTFLTTKRTTIKEVNETFARAANGELKDIIGVTDKPLVSSDIIGRSESAIVDLNLTQVIDGDLVKVVAWYDNEWGYCCRLVEMAIMVGK